MDRIRKDAALY